jgi:hypothetical protein
MEGLEYTEITSTLDGAVFGVLNLDAALPYGTVDVSTDPEKQMQDARIKGTLHIMRSVARELGQLFSEAFARERDQYS